MPHKRRLIKKQLKKLLADIESTGYFTDAGYHPVRLTDVGWCSKDIFGSEVEGIRLTTGRTSSAGLYYDGPAAVSEETAYEMQAEWTKTGDRGLTVNYGGRTEEDYNQFEKEWRNGKLE